MKGTSVPGTERTNRDVRVESAFGAKAEVGFAPTFRHASPLDAAIKM